MELKSLLKTAGWSVTRLAEAMGISHPAVSKFLSNQDNIPSDRLAQIAEITGISLDTIHNVINASKPSDGKGCDVCSDDTAPVNVTTEMMNTIILAVSGLNNRLDKIESEIADVKTHTAIPGTDESGKATIVKLGELHALMDAFYKRLDDIEEKDDSGFSITAPNKIREKIAIIPYRINCIEVKMGELKQEMADLLAYFKAEALDVKTMKETSAEILTEFTRMRNIRDTCHSEIMGYLEELTEDHKEILGQNHGRDW